VLVLALVGAHAECCSSMNVVTRRRNSAALASALMFTDAADAHTRQAGSGDHTREVGLVFSPERVCGKNEVPCCVVAVCGSPPRISPLAPPLNHRIARSRPLLEGDPRIHSEKRAKHQNQTW
jgi:hypothetical protein